MMIVDKILNWERERGYTAVYGSAEQVNEMLTDVPFADSKDVTTVVMHLVTDSATVDGPDRSVFGKTLSLGVNITAADIIEDDEDNFPKLTEEIDEI